MRRPRATEVSTVKKPVSPGQQGKIAGLAVVVMAAGLGKRMRSNQAKVLHPVAGQAMVLYSVGLGLRVAGKVDPMFVDDVGGLGEAALEHAKAGDVVIVMGAGSIGNVAPRIVELGGAA